MNRAIQTYLDQVIFHADPHDEHQAEQIRAELQDHLLTKIADLEKQGSPHMDAVLAALQDHGHPRTVGYALRRRRWIDIRTRGTARGFIAVGPKAVGTIAIGGLAFGFFACGIVGIGVISLSTIGIAMLWSYGAVLAFAPFGFAHGSIAIGLAAAGFWSCGIVALGYDSVGLYVQRWHSPLFTGTAPFPFVYLYAAMRVYLGIWPSLATSLVVHTLFYVALISAGLVAFCHRITREFRHAGYPLLRFSAEPDSY